MKSLTRCILAASALLALLSGHAQQPPKQPPANETKPAGKSAGTASKPKRQRVVSNLAGFDLLEANKSQKQPMVVGATRGLPQAVALAPRLGKVYGLNPVFAWSFAGKTDTFILILSDTTRTELFRREVTGMQIQYPTDAPALEPGKTYFWTVQAPLGMLGESTSAPAGFVVVSAGQREEIEKVLAQIASADPYERDVALARVFTDHRLWYDAIAAYSDLIVRFPDRAELFKQRAEIYAQIQETQRMSEKDFSRAEELGLTNKKPE